MRSTTLSSQRSTTTSTATRSRPFELKRELWAKLLDDRLRHRLQGRRRSSSSSTRCWSSPPRSSPTPSSASIRRRCCRRRSFPASGSRQAGSPASSRRTSSTGCWRCRAAIASSALSPAGSCRFAWQRRRARRHEGALRVDHQRRAAARPRRVLHARLARRARSSRRSSTTRSASASSTRPADPARSSSRQCGSYLAAAEAAGLSPSDAHLGATRHVIGVDVHPLAVTFARVTYLLAIGRERLTAPGRPDLHVPVYLGDSLQWGQQQTPLHMRTCSRSRPTTDSSSPASCDFPDRLLDDAGQFDRLVADLADLAATSQPGPPLPSSGGHLPPIRRTARRSGDDRARPSRTMCRAPRRRARSHLVVLRPEPRPTGVARRERRTASIASSATRPGSPTAS